MKKRALSWGLIFFFLLTLLPMPAMAAKGNSFEDRQLAAEMATKTDTEIARSSIYTVEDDTTSVLLEVPSVYCVPLDKENSSDMVLTVEGEWDSYVWEACFYGIWSDWAGDGPSLTLSKEDFTSHGFRCTVTRGGQSVTSETFAYDPAVLKRPMMLANDLSDGSLSDSSDYIRYYQNQVYKRFDIQGMDDSTAFKTTFANGGYRTAISVNQGSKVEVPYQSDAASVGSSLTAQTTLDIAYGNRYVKITYTVQNNGSTPQNFQIGSSADVMIGNNDRAEVVGVFSGDKCTGLSMDGSPKNNYKFSLVAPDCDTLWYGFYSGAYTNIFTNLANKSAGYNGDSGMAWSWRGSVAPGQTWSRYVLIGAGELPPTPNAPVLDSNNFNLYAGNKVTITGMAAADGDKPAPDTIYISFGGKEYSATVQQDGTFSVEVEVPEDTSADDSSFTYWGTTEAGGISEIKRQPVTVVVAPSISLTTDSVTVMEGETLDETRLEAFIRSSSGTVTIHPPGIDTSVLGGKTVTYTASVEGFADDIATLTVTVLPWPAELTKTTVAEIDKAFNLSATMTHTGSLTYEETGFVYGALQNPTLTLNDGKMATDSPVNSKNGKINATIRKDDLVRGIIYYARAYAKTADGTVIYGEQSEGFGVGIPQYGTFSVTNSGSTFTISRSGGTDGAQTVYYRTVNGSAIGGTHFEHQAGSVTFAAGETEKSVTVTERDVYSTFDGNAATAYSNVDRTYSFEIYRVTGGAEIDSSQKSVTRTMSKDSRKVIDRSLYTEITRNGTTDAKLRGDYKDDGLGWTQGAIGTAAIETVNIAQLEARGYLLDTADSLSYWVTFTAWEEDSGYQAIQIIAGNTLDTNIYPNEGSLIGNLTTAQYAALFEHRGSGANSTPSEYRFPTASLTNDSKLTKYQYASGQSGSSIRFDVNTSQITVGFGASGENSDNWYTQNITHHFKFSDTEEPQLLGIAPMAGGSYLPGDSVTVALVFDEIVDSANSPELDNVQIATNWGTFSCVGGADTNVLYFTGTVSDAASGPLTVNSIINAGNIKDMADDAGTATGGSVTDGNTGAALGNGPGAPTVTVGQITNINGTLTGTIAATNAAKLEYAWSTEANKNNVVGWKMLADTGGDTVSTRQTGGVWHLHARATNSDGVTAYASESVDLGGSSVQLPSLTATADNTNWAQSRPVTITRTPDNATVSVKAPGDTTETEVSGNTFTATANGVYTVTLTSGNETITKMVTVSKIDRTIPQVEIVDLANTNHTEAVTLTVKASDSESGMDAITGTWSNGIQNETAVITGENGHYTTTSPDQSGTWILTVTATDNVGNRGTEASSGYIINATRPGLMVTKQSESSTGVVYNYTVTENGNTDITVTLPDGSTTAALTGTFTITEPGNYVITVTDAAGHFVSETITVDAPQDGILDGVLPDVRLSIADENWTKGPVTVTVAVFDAGSAGKNLTAVWDDKDIQLTESAEEPGSFTGGFAVSTNGTYTVTCTDAAGNEGSGVIEIANIDTTAPGISVSGNPTDWTAGNVTITLAVTDDSSGVNRVEVKKDETPVPVSENNGIYTFTVSANGIYAVTATDKAGNSANETVVIDKIDNGEPTLSVTGGTQSAASLRLTITASAGGNSGVTVTVQKNDSVAEEMRGDTYVITSAGIYIFTATTGTGKTTTQKVVVHDITIGETAQLVVDGGKLTKPADPIRDGYTFDGWYDGDTLWDFEKNEVKNDLILTAHWMLAAPTVELTASPDGASGAYNGGNTVVTLTATATHAAGDNISYTYEWYKDGQKMNGKTAETLQLSTVADSGTYTVRVTAMAGGQSASVSSMAVTATIRKADPSIVVWPTASGITYGDDLNQSILSGGSADVAGGFAWKDSGFKPNSGFQDCIVVFAPDDMENYNTAEQTITITVAQKTLIPSVVSVANKEYDGGTATSGTITLAGALPGDTPTATGVFTFDNASAGSNKTVAVAVTLDEAWGDNYVLSTTGLTATAAITAKTVGLTWHGYEKLTYTGQPVSVTANATGLVTGDVCTVIVEDGDKVDVGDYTAKAIGLSNPNYQLPAIGITKDYTIAIAAGSASVDMENWTYGDAANSPVPASVTNGIDNVIYHYEGRDGTIYDSDAVPTDAGNYTVTAAFAATENYEAVTATAEFTIVPKPIAVTWLGLNQVYGSREPVTVSLLGVVDGDDVEISFTGMGETAGRHPLTAALRGADIANYTLKNGAAMMTIQPKSVLFHVTGNAVQADGNEKKATITPNDAAFTDYIVSYRQDGKEVSAPKAVGSYQIWVEITNPNYRHSNGSDMMQVGTLTITQAKPVLYTALFTGGEGATGIEPAQQTALAEGQIILPDNPFTQIGHRFRGWKAEDDAKLYQPGDRFTMPAQDVTFTAQWQDVFFISGSINEQADGGETPVEGAVVSIWLGANQIAEAKTGSDGKYSFPNLLPGIYNLVVAKDVRTITQKATIDSSNAENCNVTLPKGATNSVVEVFPGSPDIVVGKLDTVFDNTDPIVYTQDDQKNVNEGGKVEITFTAEEKTHIQSEEQVANDIAQISKISDGSILGLVMDYKLGKTVTTADGVTGDPTLIPQANVLLEVLLPLPTELQGKDIYSVYRVHSRTGKEEDKEAQELKQGEANKNELGEYFIVNRDKTRLTLYVKCFSTYAIGYADSSESNGGSQGGGSSAPVYPPNIEETEHGSVASSSRNPEKGDQVTITPIPDEGYTVDEVIVTDSAGKPVEVIPNDDGTYTFTQPIGEVTITVTFRQMVGTSDCPRDDNCPMAAFSDAELGAWYHDGVHYCLENSLMVGTGKTTFEPDAATTRGMIVTILWRLEGSPMVNHPILFDDVDPEDWYGKAVGWADSIGVITGYGNGKFGPHDPITREQMAAILWRYAGSPHVKGSLSSFVDETQTSHWAQPSMIWAVDQELITGVNHNQLAPQGSATRAQVATILMRFAGKSLN